LLPRGIFKKRIISKLPDEIKEDIDRNCGRIRYDFLERMQKSAIDFEWTLDEKINTAVDGIHLAIERAKDIKMKGTEETKTRLLEIERDIRELKLILSSLDK